MDITISEEHRSGGRQQTVNLSSEEDTSMREIQRIQTFSTFYFKDRSVERRFGSGLVNH
jgi:hypothetical protein